jgi:hypothetical protein
LHDKIRGNNFNSDKKTGMKTINKLLISCFLLTTVIAFPQIIIRKGEVSGTWAQQHSPYLITGDIYVPENSLLTIESGVHVIFQSNSSIKIKGQLLAIGNEADSIIFTAENAEVGWAGIHWLNLGIFENNVFSRLEYCKFSFSKSRGRFPENYGGAIGIMNTNNVVISHCLFTNCEALKWGEAAAKGGAMALVNADARISHCTFRNNTSTFGGALVLVSGSKPIIDNCLFVENSALQYGGAVEVMELSNPSFVNCTFADNYSEYGGGAFDLFSKVRVYLLNCILSNNQSGRVLDQVNVSSENATITFAYCNVEGGVEAIVPNSTTNFQKGNINMPPAFMGTGIHPYMPETGSPCINAGTTDSAFYPAAWHMPDEDIAGNFRIYAESIDMGCYEYVFDKSKLPPKEKPDIAAPENQEMLIYPCPARTTLNFQYQLTEDTQVRLMVFDMQGRTVAKLLNSFQNKGLKTFEWDVQFLPKGTYIYRMNAEEEIRSGIILVTH